MEFLKGPNKPIALGGSVEVILLGCKALGDSERLSQGYWVRRKILIYSLVWGPPLCLDTDYLCFLGEKSATMLHVRGMDCETKHCPPRVLGICYTLSL